MKYLILLIFTGFSAINFAQWSQNTTPTYPELIAYYQKLDREHLEIELYAMGDSDTEWPIYVCVINGAKDSLKTFENARNATTILVNNAIHPGEPDGVNACLIWIDRWIANGKPTKNLPVIAFIPAYNVGGMLNRSSNSRANQNGPEEYGFRGNAQNLDLNRDFIKMDSPNAFTFATIFQALNPDVFVDTHVSNGADYQYTLTYISSMKERMQPATRDITYKTCIPALISTLKKNYQTDLFPYVELTAETPEGGIMAFNDLPRYAMGYAALFHTISFTVETHMLKPFPDRVKVTDQFLTELIKWTGECSVDIEKARKEAIQQCSQQAIYPLNYQLSKKADSIVFKGYEAIHKPSVVTGMERLYYDRTKPYKKQVPYFGSYSATDSVKIPEFYVLSGASKEVIRRLKVNGVEMKTLKNDSLLIVNVQQIRSYESGKSPYEGHYLHGKVQVGRETDTLLLRKGSLMIPLDQERRNFVISVLEPKSEDSYFNWNFFDSHLQQKEYFSAYVFEDIAAQLLEKDPDLAQEFYEKKRTDQQFASNPDAQLRFIYMNSPYYEKNTANRLPVWEISVK